MKPKRVFLILIEGNAEFALSLTLIGEVESPMKFNASIPSRGRKGDSTDGQLESTFWQRAVPASPLARVRCVENKTTYAQVFVANGFAKIAMHHPERVA